MDLPPINPIAQANGLPRSMNQTIMNLIGQRNDLSDLSALGIDIIDECRRVPLTLPNCGICGFVVESGQPCVLREFPKTKETQGKNVNNPDLRSRPR